MVVIEPDLHYVDVVAMRHLTSGLTFHIEECAGVLDAALKDLNKQTGLPNQILDWIRVRTLTAKPCPDGGKGRIIVEVSQTLNGAGKHGYFATVMRKTDERETTPVVFFKMNSPLLDIPMRVEVPLRALMVGNPPLPGTYTLYMHALLTSQGNTFLYYGITKRGWSLRFNEHMRAALAQKSKRLLAGPLMN